MPTTAVAYKRDSKGNLRTWQAEIEGDKYRTIAGLLDGKKVVSEWTVCTPKSQDTAEAQAIFEANAALKHQTDREYRLSVAELDAADADGTMLFKPMLAKKPDDVKPDHFKGRMLFSQPKLDGFRCIITSKGAFTREGKPIVSADHILELFKPLLADYQWGPDVVLDGELYNHAMKDEFQTLSGLLKRGPKSEADFAKLRETVQFHWYDVVLPKDLKAPYSMRREALTRMFQFMMEGNPNFYPTVQPVVTVKFNADVPFNVVQEELDKLNAGYLADGFEGQMIRLDMPYENKRSAGLIKIKEFIDAEFPIVDVQEGNGNWTGACKRVVIRLPDGTTNEASPRGKYPFLADILADREKWIDGTSTVTVRYFRLTDDNKLYLPIVTAWHLGGRTL